MWRASGVPGAAATTTVPATDQKVTESGGTSFCNFFARGTTLFCAF
jgi:hypothetical protein